MSATGHRKAFDRARANYVFLRSQERSKVNVQRANAWKRIMCAIALMNIGEGNQSIQRLLYLSEPELNWINYAVDN